jgi:hypothetical protein
LIKSQKELIKAWGRTFPSEIHKLIHSIWNKEELLEEWKESIIVPIYRKGDKTDYIYIGMSLLPINTKFYPTSSYRRELHMQRKLVGPSVWISTQQFNY